jgi:lipopolysaccharide transport system permease protein
VGERALETVISASSPPLRTQFAEYWEYRGLLGHLVAKELKIRYRQTALGLFWALAQPLLPAIILGAVFSRSLSSTKDVGPPYILFLLAGLVPWSFLSVAVTTASNSFISNGYILSKVYFPRAILPASMVAAASIEFACGTAVLCLWTLLSGCPIHLIWLELPILFGCTAILAFFVSIGIASLNVLYRDIRHALPFLMQIWMYSTPIIYSPTLVPARWRWLLGLSPMTCVVLGFRHVLFGTPFDMRLEFTSAVAGIVAAITGILIYQRLQHDLAERV